MSRFAALAPRWRQVLAAIRDLRDVSTEIADVLGCSHHDVARIARRLERRGLIERAGTVRYGRGRPLVIWRAKGAARC